MADRIFVSLAAAGIVLVLGLVSSVIFLLAKDVPWAPYVLVAAVLVGVVVFVADLATGRLRR